MTTFWKVLCVSSLVAVIVLGAALNAQTDVDRKILAALNDIMTASVLQQNEIRLLEEEMEKINRRTLFVERQADIIMAAARTGWKNAYRLLRAGAFDERREGNPQNP